MIIRDEQSKVFSAWMAAVFKDRVLNHLCQQFPRQVDSLGEDQVRTRIREGMGRASGYGIVSEQGVCFFIDLAFIFGADFDHQLSWAVKVLDVEHIHESDRLLRLRLEANLHLDEAVALPQGVEA